MSIATNIPENKQNFNLFLAEAIQKSLDYETEKIYEKRKKEMLEEIRSKKEEIIRNTVKDITKTMDSMSMHQNLIITIRKEKE